MENPFNLSNITNIFSYSLESYYTLIPRDIFLSLIVTVIVIGIYLASEYNIRLTVGVLLLFDFFLFTVIISPIILSFCIVSALAGAYALYRSFYG